MFGKLHPNEFKQLRSEVKESTEEELYSAFEHLWKEEQAYGPMPATAKLKVFDSVMKETRTTFHALRWLKVASVVLLPLLLAWGSYRALYTPPASQPVPDMVVMADAGQKTHLLLPDGSKVWLNSQSSLSYPADFGVNNRRVKLKGEGYFEIARDDKKEFSVETDGVNVVVHGTKFNVAAHPSAPDMRISLLEGSISVEDKNNQILATLAPQHSMLVQKQTLHYQIIEENTDLTALWSQHQCRVEHATAQEMFKRMEYWYGLKIHLANKQTHYNYSFTIKDESFRELLALINKLTPLTYSINGEEVVIQYK